MTRNPANRDITAAGILTAATLLIIAGLPFMAGAQSLASNNSQDKARVIIYRYKQFVGSGVEPSVYCDDAELARMDNGRFFSS